MCSELKISEKNLEYLGGKGPSLDKLRNCALWYEAVIQALKVGFFLFAGSNKQCYIEEPEV